MDIAVSVREVGMDADEMKELKQKERDNLELAERIANELGSAEMLCGPYMDAVPIIMRVLRP